MDGSGALSPETDAMPNHSILTEYEQMLSGMVREGRITESTKSLRLLHANRLLEACLRSLTPQALTALVHVWFPGGHSGGGYTRVIEELQVLLTTRGPVPRRPVR
jgi:hypothetical protein